jgi:hypothetical protein
MKVRHFWRRIDVGIGGAIRLKATKLLKDKGEGTSGRDVLLTLPPLPCPELHASG